MNKLLLRCIALLAASLAANAAWSGGVSPESSGARRTYDQERAHCLLGESSQSRDTCLREAAAAYAAARHGELLSPPASELARNATLRCEAHPPADRAECIRRIEGPSHLEGSVGGGGLLRSSETTEFR